MNKRLELRVVASFFVFSLVGLSACDSANQQQEFLEEAQSTPSGFSTTDASGVVQNEDADDWRTSPLFLGRAIMEPAYPNPATGGLVTIPLRILQFDEVVGGVFVSAFDASGRLVILGQSNETGSPGLYTIAINPSQIGSTGLHRIFVQDVFGEIISYGDLMIE